MADKLFDRETAVINAAKSAIDSDKIDKEAFQSLLSDYQKLSKTTRRLVKISDRSEKDLLEARKQAEAATRAKAAFLATMSHEIRTPMNGVIGMIDLLWQTDLKNDQKEMMSTVRDSAFALLTIINDILDSSKIEAGKMQLESIPVSIRDIVEGVAESLAPNATAKELEMATFVDPAIPESLLGDPVRIRQILLNLASNAVKFTANTPNDPNEDQNRVMIHASCVDASDTPSENTVHVRIDVVDHGIGMTEEAVTGLFKPFAQADSSTTRRFGGTGLGLSICKSLTDIMGGSIGATSTVGDGSVFSLSVTFPVDPDAPHTEPTPELAGLRILATCADGRTRDTLAAYLENWGAEVEPTDNLPDAEFQLISGAMLGTPFDLVVLGDDWPDEDRLEMCQRLLDEDTPSPSVILLARQRAPGVAIDGVSMKWVRTAPLRRAHIVNAVANLAGRAEPEMTSREDELIITAPTSGILSIEEAESSGRLILVADDNPTNLNVISRQLKLLGYTAETVNDGQEAFNALATKSYGLLLTDCHMPNMDGYQLSRAVRAKEEEAIEVDPSNQIKHKHLPIVAITASALQGEDQKCFDAGMDGYLTKPLELPKLKALLEQWLGETDDTDLPETISTSPPTQTAGAVDPSVLSNMFGDDPATLREILQEFVDPAKNIVADIKNGFEARNAGGIGAAAHKMKSAARSVGANDLADLCAELEEAGNLEAWDRIDAEVPRIDETFTEVLNYIESL